MSKIFFYIKSQFLWIKKRNSLKLLFSEIQGNWLIYYLLISVGKTSLMN